MKHNPSEIFVCTVFHHSEIRPRGLEMANQFIDSWKKSNLGYRLIVVDNESSLEFTRLKEIDHIFIRVENQDSSGGITGAWNSSIKEAIKHKARVITGFADDVKINTSLTELVNSTVDPDTIYVPLTDGMLDLWPNQKSDRVKPNFIQKVNSINGFWMSFTSDFYMSRHINGDLFDLESKEIGKWSKQENALKLWNKIRPTNAIIVGDCWLHHTKLRSWREAREKFKN